MAPLATKLGSSFRNLSSKPPAWPLPPPKAKPNNPKESKRTHMVEENPNEYGEGGYLPVEIGDSFKDGRYLVVRKLGYA